MRILGDDPNDDYECERDYKAQAKVKANVLDQVDI